VLFVQSCFSNIVGTVLLSLLVVIFYKVGKNFKPVELMFLMFVSRVKPTSLQSKKPDGYTRFVCISDTLNLHRKLQYPLPDGKSWYNNSRLKELVKFTEAMLFFFVH